MTNFKFEGDFETLSDSQLKFVENVLQKQGFKEGKVVVEPVGQKGDNYIANVKRFIHETSDGSAFKMIGKVAPAAELLRQMMKTRVLFNNEIIMYEEVIPKLNQIQDKIGAPANERVRFPVCYGVLNEEPYELILLEDLRELNFGMLDRFQPIPNDGVRLVLKDLAIFHSLSYALKNMEPETYKNITERLINMWELLDEDPETQMYMEITENDMKALLDSEKHKQVLTGSLSQTAALGKKIRSYEKGSKYAVIQQGDCWTNNILFKLEDGKPVENIMIDYQLSKETSPVADLLYFLLNCTDHASRCKHFTEWIDYYHEMLDDSLDNYNLKSKLIFPRDQLDADLRRYGKMMIGFGLMISGMIVRESKDVVDFKAMEDVNREEMMDTAMTQMRAGTLDDTTLATLKNRVTGLVNTALEFGLV